MRDRLALFASGNGNVDELRASLPRDAEDVFYGFCRVQENDGKSFLALISYTPNSISGVRRGA